MDAAVAGVPNELLGGRVVGFVCLAKSAGSVTLDVIRCDPQDRIAAYKVPERLTVVDVIPHNGNSKIDRKALLNMGREYSLDALRADC